MRPTATRRAGWTLLLFAGLLFSLVTVPAHAQTGPGGVGNASGADGQPANLLWLRGDEGVTTSGGSVTDWLDQSGNNHDVIQGTATNQPMLSGGALNGRDVVTFDGSDDFLVDDPSSYLNGQPGVTAIIVSRSNVGSGSDASILDTDSDFGDSQDDLFSVRYDGDGSDAGGNNIIKFGLAADGNTNSYRTEVTEDGVQTENPQLITYRYQDGEGDPLVLLDGSTVGSSTLNTPSGNVSDMARFVVGRGAFDGSSSWDGDIAEVILFGTGLNEAERTVVHTYLSEKYNEWGTGTEILSYNYTGTHFGSFAGIGRASDGTAHTDAQSAELRLLNPSELSNGDFVLFGHDESAFSLTTSERPNGDANAQKTTREWRVDLTGASTQTVDVEVDVSSLSLPSGFDDFGIFVDSDGDGDFSTGSPDFYPLDGSNTASNVSLADGDYVTVGAVNRTVQFASANASGFENDGGDNLGDAFAPVLEVELNYASADDLSIPFEVAEGTSTLVEDETTVSGRDNPDYRRSSPGSFTIPAGTTTLNFNTAGGLDSAPDPALEIVNDARDAVTNAGDESSPEDLAINLTGTFPTGVSAGATSTLTFEILDDDDPRKISFAGAGGKPVKLLNSNPEETNDTNTDDLSDDEGAVNSVQFEVALPEGVEGSQATFAVFEISGADVSDFDIPDNSTQNKLTDRRGEVQVNNTQQVNSTNTGYGTFTVDILDNSIFESDETITIELVSARSGTIDQDPAANLDFNYTILDDDAAPTVSFSTGSASGDESVSTVNATLQLSGTAGTDLDVDFSVAGTATGGGDDYTQNISSPITIPAGQTSRDLTFSIADDSDQELAETIEVTVTDNSTTDANVGSPSTFTYTIVDNDGLGSTGPGGVGDSESNLLWLRADAIDGVSDGSALNEWGDASGNSHDLTAATAPTYNDGTGPNAINGLPVVTFGGNGEYLEDDGNGNYLNELDAVSVFSAVQSAATGTDAGYFDTEGSANGRDELLAIRYDDVGANSGRDDVIKIGINDEAQQLETSETIGGVSVQHQTVPQIHQVRWARGSDLTFALNGTDDNGNNLLSGSAVNAPLQTNTVEVGRGPKASSTNGWNGQVAELFVYNTALNTTQRTIVQNYLSAKYNVTLTGTDVYAGDANANSDGDEYDLGVFGVGQESNTDFHVAAETDGLRFERVTGLSNDDYLLAGYAVADNTVNTSDIDGVSGNLEARMDRDWYWDTNGGSPTVAVVFDLSKAGFPSVLNPDPSNYVLLYRSGTSGNWSEVSSSATVDNGDEITFASVNAGTNGDGYYTLGTTNQDASPISDTAITIVGTDGNEGTASNGSLGGDAGWRMVGPPVTGATVGNIVSDVRDPFIFNQITQGDQLYRWDDTNGQWEVLRDDTDPFDSGRGHILFLFDDNEGPIDPTLTIDVDAGTVPDPTDPNTNPTVSVAQDAQWHLLANPYNQAYNLNVLENGSGAALSSGNTDFQTTVQIWDGGSTSGERGSTQGTYVPIETDTDPDNLAPDGRVISAWQGFFVERSGSGDTQITFNRTGTTSGDRSIVGSNKAEGPGSEALAARIGLEMTVEDGDGTQIARDAAASVKWHENATEGWDAFDATKLTPLLSTYATIAPVGPTRDGTPALKAQESRPLPDAEEPFTVPMDIETTGDIAGTATLTSRVWQGVPPEWEMTLVDTKGTPDASDDEAVAWTPEATYTFALGGEGSSSEAKGSSSRAATQKVRQHEEGAVRRPPRPEALNAQRPASMLAGPAPEADSSASSKSKTSKESTPPRFVLEVDPSGTPLPVELQELTVQQRDQRARLQWTTASETNNAGFYVQTQPLSADSTTTASAWTDLGFVEGNGTTDAPQSYRFETGEMQYGTHAFRLRQVDADGTATTTDAVTVDVQLDRAYAVEAPYPNPSNGQATLPVTVRESQRVRVILYDILGRRIATVHDEEIRGQDTQAIQLDTGRLASGTYFVRVQGDDFLTTERVTVVH